MNHLFKKIIVIITVLTLVVPSINPYENANGNHDDVVICGVDRNEYV